MVNLAGLGKAHGIWNLVRSAAVELLLMTLTKSLDAETSVTVEAVQYVPLATESEEAAASMTPQFPIESGSAFSMSRLTAPLHG